MAILDTPGAEVVGYSYDAWGNPLDTTGSMKLSLGLYNPLRYRGYVYDQETGLYYLQSRYYNPEMGRFINADNRISNVGGNVLGNNMFAYCMNNPINMSDPTGNWSIWAIVAVVVVATIVIPTIVNHIINANNKSKIDSEIKETYTKEEAKKEIDDLIDLMEKNSNVNGFYGSKQLVYTETSGGFYLDDRMLYYIFFVTLRQLFKMFQKDNKQINEDIVFKAIKFTLEKYLGSIEHNNIKERIKLTRMKVVQGEDGKDDFKFPSIKV